MSDELPETLYTEACKTTLHYSTLCAHVRTLTIVQGIVILGSAGFLVKDSHYYYLMYVTAFGLLLTGVLWAMHYNYYMHFNSVLNSTVVLEKELVGDNEVTGPWESYNVSRNNCLRKRERKFAFHFGTFILLVFSLSMLFIYGVAGILC